MIIYDEEFEEYIFDFKKYGFNRIDIDSHGIIWISNVTTKIDNDLKKYIRISKINDEIRILYTDYYDNYLSLSENLYNFVCEFIKRYYKVNEITLAFVEDYNSLFDGELYFCEHCNTQFYSAVNYCSICGRKIVPKKKEIKYRNNYEIYP